MMKFGTLNHMATEMKTIWSEFKFFWKSRWRTDAILENIVRNVAVAAVSC